MSFDGYLEFGGIEIINAARTAAYVHNLMPAFGLVTRHLEKYETLPVALGDAPYRTPYLDNADWVETDAAENPSPRNPSHNFYGLYPLSIEGIGDSTMGATVVEGVLDGGTVNSQRDATRSVRVRGLLIGADQLAVESGLTWLRNALRANSCGLHGDLCGYQDLRYFLAPPDVCDPAWMEGFPFEHYEELGSLTPASSPYIRQHGVEGQPHRYRWVFEPAANIDGVKIHWGALDWDSAEVLEEHGPTYLRRSNFLANPTFRTNTVGWLQRATVGGDETDDTVVRVVAGGRDFARVGTTIATIKSNWLPDPSFEHGDPETNGWRASGDLTVIPDVDSPTGAKFARIPASPVPPTTDPPTPRPPVWIEATMLGSYDETVGVISFFSKYAGHVVVTVSDDDGDLIYADDYTSVYAGWARNSVPNVPLKRGYVVRIQFDDGSNFVDVDGFLLEENSTSTPGDYFDGDTPPVVSGYAYSWPDGYAGPSRGVDMSGPAGFPVTKVRLASLVAPNPVGDVVISFDMRAPVTEPIVTIRLSSGNGANVSPSNDNGAPLGAFTVTPTRTWERYAISFPATAGVYVNFEAPSQFDIDNVMIESGRELNDYFDASFPAPPDYVMQWMSAADNSVSRMTWIGSTEIEMRTNFRYYLSLDQGTLSAFGVAWGGTAAIPMETQLDAYDRTYHDVTCSVGVNRIRDLVLETGAATEVDFVMTAATPHAFSTVGVELPFDGEDPSYVLDEVVNLALNPSVETGLAGFTVGTSGGAVAQSNPTSPTAFGTKVHRATWSAASTGQLSGSMYTSAPDSIVAGQVYSFASHHVKSSINQRLVMILHWLTNADALISQTSTAMQVSAGAVNVMKVENALAPPLATKYRLHFMNVAGTGFANWPVNSYLEVDGVMVNRGPVAQDYVDGSLPDTDAYTYSWDGPADASTSRRKITVNVQDPLIDPDLPAVPTAPRPPVIPDLAITDQNEWLRYYLDIPPGNVGLWAGTVPTLTLSTRAEDIRQLRVRFFPNPFGYDPEELDETAYCGEFLLSYLPANSQLTVSGVTQEAWAQVAGGAPQPANQLLYGTDGTPMDWPELSCGLPYVMTVDIPPTTDIDNLDISLAINRRE